MNKDAVYPDRSNEITAGKGIQCSGSPFKIEIDAEHFRPKFKAIIEDTVGWCGMHDQECDQKLEDALIQCLKDSDKV